MFKVGLKQNKGKLFHSHEIKHRENAGNMQSDLLHFLSQYRFHHSFLKIETNN